MQNKYLFPLIPLLLFGCTPSVKVTPDKLPDAYPNQPYQADIEITGGTVSDMTFYTRFSDSSFKITPSIAEGGYKDYNLLTVTGTPTTLEPVSVYIAGSTYGTNFPGKEFEKKYTIEIKVAE